MMQYILATFTQTIAQSIHLKLNKNIPVYISNYHTKFLKFKIERLGFKVFELENGVIKKLGNNFFLTIYPADNCDPKLCFKFNGCAKLDDSIKGSQQIDSLSVIDDGKFVLLNVNDCPFELAKHVIKKVLKEFNKIDVLFKVMVALDLILNVLTIFPKMQK